MSRMLFTPAHTTASGVRPSSVRSALTSKDCWAPRCTPPRPPVTKTRMPAIDARRIVDADRGRPVGAAGDNVGQVADADLAHLGVAAEQLEVLGRQADPSSTAMVAGTAPCSRTMPSTSVAMATLSG